MCVWVCVWADADGCVHLWVFVLCVCACVSECECEQRWLEMEKQNWKVFSDEWFDHYHHRSNLPSFRSEKHQILKRAETVRRRRRKKQSLDSSSSGWEKKSTLNVDEENYLSLWLLLGCQAVKRLLLGSSAVLSILRTQVDIPPRTLRPSWENNKPAEFRKPESRNFEINCSDLKPVGWGSEMSAHSEIGIGHVWEIFCNWWWLNAWILGPSNCGSLTHWHVRASYPAVPTSKPISLKTQENTFSENMLLSNCSLYKAKPCT